MNSLEIANKNFKEYISTNESNRKILISELKRGEITSMINMDATKGILVEFDNASDACNPTFFELK